MTPTLGTVFAAPGTATGYAAIAVAVLMLALWLASIALRDVSIVDPSWGPAFVLVAAVAAVAGGGCLGRRWLLLAMTAVWGLRLGTHLLLRKLRDPAEDRRYAAMRERRGASFIPWSLVMVFGLQGLLVLIVSLPVQVAAGQGGTLTVAVIPGVALWAVGFAFESIGDEQLRRFKARSDSGGQVMDRGLWRYTRHPNYFGDFCVWWGIWLVALTAGGAWWTFVGPVVMSILLIRVSGAGLLEKDIGQRRPGYADYIRRTSGFFPLPPKRPSGDEAGRGRGED
jgi:steroid 5-alpha reductase family enzyme